MRFCRDIEKVSKALFLQLSARFLPVSAAEGPRHLLVINLMRAVRRGGCDSSVALVAMVEAATVDIPGVADVSLTENLSTQRVNQTCKLQGISPTDDIDVTSLPQGPLLVTHPVVCR